MISGSIVGQKLTISTPIIVSDTINYLTAQFSFKSPEWEGLAKYAHFKRGDEVYDKELINNAITADEGLNLSAGEWTLYIHGVLYKEEDIALRITTSEVNFVVLQSGALNGEMFPSIGKSYGEEILATVNAFLEGKLTPSTAEDVLPEYWLAHLTKKAEEICCAIEEAGHNKSAFLFYTDAHWGYGSKKSPQLLKWLQDHTAINKINFGGDFCNTYEVAEDAYMSTMREWRLATRALKNHHSVIGNHDADILELSTKKQRYGFLLAPEETNDVVRGDYFHYYIDDKPEKTRYLYLDTGLCSISDDCLQFTIDALSSTPSGWHIVAISHIWFVYNDTSTPTVGTVPEYSQKLLSIFDAYNGRKNGSIALGNGSTSYDFRDSEGWVEFCIGGHTHVDYDFTTESGIPVILTQTDSYHCRGEYTYEEGTISEASVSAIVADYDAHIIHVIRVGRGEERDVPITVYEISYNNVLPNAIDLDGSIYNGCGYKLNTRWSSSSESETANGADGLCLSGYISVSNEDVIYLKNIIMDPEINNGCLLLLYKEFSEIPKGIHSFDNLNIYHSAEWDENGCLKQFTIPIGYTYIRLQACYIGSDSVVTVNEPIE